MKSKFFTRENSRKPLSELNLMDDLMFNFVVDNPEVAEPFCRMILSVFLQRKVGKLRIVAQRAISADEPDKRGIRLDVEIEEYAEEKKDEHADDKVLVKGSVAEKTLNDRPSYVYDIEPHLKDNMHLPKHNRFYQAKLDSRYMRSGEKEFTVMPEQYVITITNHDPFGYDYMMYTMENRCIEVPELVYDDGLHFIYFYTKGTKGGNEEIQAMLRYFRKSIIENVVDKATQTLHECVSKVKDSKKAQEQYMTLGDFIDYEREDAREEGRSEGERIGRTEGERIGRSEGERIGRTEGERTGKVNDILQFLSELGEIPEAIRSKIMSETNTDTLRVWLKAAARAESLEEWKIQVQWNEDWYV